MVGLCIPVLVGDGVMAPAQPRLRGALGFRVPLVFPERPPKCSILTPASALAAQTDVHGATNDTQPR